MSIQRVPAKPLVVLVGAFAMLLGFWRVSVACDTWVALGDATTCTFTILGKNSDRPVFDCQPLVYHPGKQWPAAATIDLARVTIAQVAQTYTTIGSSPYWSWGYEEGINEHSVAIGNEAIHTKVLSDEIAAHRAGKGPAFGPTGMDLVRLGLERGKTAREALDAIAAVVEKHGQFGSASPTGGPGGAYHNSFIIADPKEAWVLETTGNHWVAKPVRKGTTSISNGVSLGTDFEVASAGVVQHAITKSWWPADKAKEFHFQHAYSPGTSKDDSVVTRVHPRAACSRRLLDEKAGQIDTRWMMHIARSPRIDMNATASGSVAVLPDTSDQIPVYWWCASVPSRSCFVPFFIHGSGLPTIVSTAGTHGNRVEAPSKTARDKFSADSYWWLFRDLADQVAKDPAKRTPIVRKEFDALENGFAAGLPDVVKTAVRLGKNGQKERAADVLDNYTEVCLDKATVKVNELRHEFRETVSASRY